MKLKLHELNGKLAFQEDCYRATQAYNGLSKPPSDNESKSYRRWITTGRLPQATRNKSNADESYARPSIQKQKVTFRQGPHPVETIKLKSRSTGTKSPKSWI